jgi:hypothetical protein
MKKSFRSDDSRSDENKIEYSASASNNSKDIFED